MSIFDVIPLNQISPDLPDFRERLDYVLAGRKIYPWAKSLGISRGAAESINGGTIPGSAILRAIHDKEFVNISWLISGDGMPFRTYYALSSFDLHNILEDHVRTDIFDKTVYICADTTRIAIFLSSPATYDFKGETVTYTKWDGYAGDFSHSIYDLLLSAYRGVSQFNSDQWFSAMVTPNDLIEIFRGKRSPIHLFGDGNKLNPALKTRPVHDIEKEFAPLLNQLDEQQSAMFISSDANIHPDILCSVIDTIDSRLVSSGKTISLDQKSRLYSTIYNECKTRNISPDAIPEITYKVLVDMI